MTDELSDLFSEMQDSGTKKETSELVTSCEDCIFLEDLDCKLGNISKYQKRGVRVLQSEGKEGQPTLTVGTICHTYRTELWELANDDAEDILDVLESETDPKVGFFILVKNNHEGLERSIKSILDQEIFSAKYILVSSTHETDQIEIIQKTQSILADTEIPYKVQRILEEEVTDDQFIDLSFSNAKNGYYCVLECGHEIPSDLIKILHKALVFDLHSVAYVEGYEGVNGRTVQCSMHKFLIGNKGATVKTKILEGEDYDRQQAKSELRPIRKDSMVKTWDELRK